MREEVGVRRLLVVLSGDYGELGMAQYFVAGQTFAASTVFAAPAKLRNALIDLDRDVRIYSCVEDLVAIARDVQPDVAILFSGYLLTADRLFALSPFIPALSSVAKLLDHLERSGCATVTNDPFCGLSGRVKPWTFRFVATGLYPRSVRERLLAPIRSLLTYAYCRRVHGVLRRLPHLYAGRGPVRLDSCATLAFFNERARHGDESARPSETAAPRTAHDKPTWLFILAEIDLIVQSNLHGAQLAPQIAARLGDAWRNGRTPILIAPARLLRDVRLHLDADSGAKLLDVIPYEEFVRELTRCEFAFYWNVFSFSTLLRLIRRQPVFFFDKGHLSRLLTPFYDVAIDSYFEGHEPVALNADEALTPARVSALARDSSEFAARVSTALERQPSPAEVIETLLSARRTTTSAAT